MVDSPGKRIGQMAFKRRSELGYDQEWVANQAKIDKKTYGRWERGEVENPNRSKVYNVCKVLEIPKQEVDQLYDQCEKSAKGIQTGTVEKLHLLVEYGPTFCEDLRSGLSYSKFAHSAQVTDYLKQNHNPDHPPLGNYFFGMEEFLSDPHAKWLLTVIPEEDRLPIPKDRFTQWAKELEKNDKYMVCIESGVQFSNYVNNQTTNPRVFVIRTHHKECAVVAAKHMREIWGTQSELRVLVLPGPNVNSSVSNRNEIYSRFFGNLAMQVAKKSNDDHSQWSDQWLDFRIMCQPFPDWDRSRAKNIVIKLNTQLELENDAIHKSFVCANDDVAMGVCDAVSELVASKELSKLNISVFGYDGTEELTQSLKRGMSGGTTSIWWEGMFIKLDSILKSYVIGDLNKCATDYRIKGDFIVGSDREK